MENSILSIKNLHKKYGKVHAVNDVSLDIYKGNVYGILGPNGSGKSTTLGIVLNVVNKTSGEYNWFGGKLETHDALKKVGAIIERPNFYPYMSAKENLELVCKIKGINYSKVDEKLEVVGLIDRKDSKQAVSELIKLGRRMKENNWSTVIFAEGTRAKDGRLKPFQVGGIATLLKVVPNALLVPIAIENSWQIVRFGMFPLTVGNPIKWTVLKPIDKTNKNAEEIVLLAENAIREKLNQPIIIG